MAIKKTKRKAAAKKSVAGLLHSLKRKGYTVAHGAKATRRLIKHVGKKKARRRNPGEEDRASDVYAEFHGRRPDVVIDIDTPVHVHTKLPGIGKLVKLVVRTHLGPTYDVTLGFDGRKVMLAQNNQKNQLFIVGGNQAVNLKDFNIVSPVHESEFLGTIERVFYDTVKDHLGDTGGDAIYNHKFGRIKPILLYDTRNKLLSISGGGYTMPAEGIKD